MKLQQAKAVEVSTRLTVRNLSFVSLFVLAATVYQAQLGAFYTWDSDVYLIMANKLAHQFSLERSALYAPLYPLTISIPQMVGFDTNQAVQTAWFISFFLIAVSAYLLSRSVVVAVMALLFLFATEATAFNYRYAWTEMGYAALLTTAISGLFIHITNTDNRKALLMFLIALALLPVQRYIGGYMSFLLGLIFIGFSVDRKMFLRRSGMSALAAIPTVLVILHNYELSGHFAGKRSAAISGFVQNAELSWSTLVQSFQGEMVLVAVTITISIIMVFRTEHQRKLAVFLLLLALLPVAQIIFQIISSSSVHIDQINERYFIVITPVVFINILIISLVWGQSRRRMFFTAVVVALITNMLLGQSDKFDRSQQSSQAATPLRQYLANLPVSEVGLYADETRHLLADEVLTNKIIPSSHCSSYQAIGDLTNSIAVFAPDCEQLPGHSYWPVTTTEEALRYPVILIFPIGNYFDFVGALHAQGYKLHRIETVLIMERDS